MAGSKGRPRALRYATKNRRLVAHRTGTAAEVIGPLAPGVRVTGLTAGQFSSIDALEHMVDELGPADVRISTWTTGIYDIERTQAIRLEGRIAGETSKFGGSLSTSLGATNLGVIGPQAFYSDTPIRVTALGSDFTGGSIRLAIHYLTVGVPS